MFFVAIPAQYKMINGFFFKILSSVGGETRRRRRRLLFTPTEFCSNWACRSV